MAISSLKHKKQPHLFVLFAGAGTEDHPPQELHQPAIVVYPVHHLHKLDCHRLRLEHAKCTVPR